ncbi:NADH-ubiquinone oxidoreductase 21kDa subunit [Coprinopsis cinerea AmutBmut pab1-1]|nr:NADH-ubiquinone oxidoreductase 21kDa subunit [Coprinopsis cinerea AmutBmut pab1-1]
MSLLRAAQAVARPGAGLRTTVGARFNSSKSDPTPATSTKDSAVVPTPPPTEEILAADTISGAPTELRQRVVRIYQPTRNTMQSGSGKTERWRIDFDILPGGSRWENPLMGWASSCVQSFKRQLQLSDFISQCRLHAGYPAYIQVQGGRGPFRRKAG